MVKLKDKEKEIEDVNEDIHEMVVDITIPYLSRIQDKLKLYNKIYDEYMCKDSFLNLHTNVVSNFLVTSTAHILKDLPEELQQEVIGNIKSHLESGFKSLPERLKELAKEKTEKTD